jgi:hypothetical protein
MVLATDNALHAELVERIKSTTFKDMSQLQNERRRAAGGQDSSEGSGSDDDAALQKQQGGCLRCQCL